MQKKKKTAKKTFVKMKEKTATMYTWIVYSTGWYRNATWRVEAATANSAKKQLIEHRNRTGYFTVEEELSATCFSKVKNLGKIY